MIYLDLQEDNPKQRYVTVDTGAVVVRLSLEEAEGIAIGILQLLSGRPQPHPNVVNIAEFTEKTYVLAQSADGSSSTG